jgi:hypothetical protein
MRLNDLFPVIHNSVGDVNERHMMIKTLRLMIRYRNRNVANSIDVDVTRNRKEELKTVIALFDRECARRVDDVLALAPPVTPPPPMASPLATPFVPASPLTLVVNASGFDKIVIDFGNGKQVTLCNI